MNYEDYKNKLPYPSKPIQPKPPAFASDSTTKADIAKYNKQLAEHAKDMERYGKELDEYREQKAAYGAETLRLEEQFWKDAFEELGIKMDHPLAETLKKQAWEHGHSAGYSEVYSYLVDFSDFLEPVPGSVTLQFGDPSEARHFQHWWSRNKGIFDTDYKLEVQRYKALEAEVASRKKAAPARRRTRRVR